MKKEGFSIINNHPDQDGEKTTEKLGELLKKNRAAALGLAVMIATGAFFLGCSKASKPGDRESLVDGIEDDDGYDFVGDSDGDGGDSSQTSRRAGYYHFAGAPMMMAGNRLMWGSKPHSPSARSGYAISRGGRAGS
jgi:hypothetical protein